MRAPRLLSLVSGLSRDERGATAIEYALLAGLIGLALVGAFTTLGNSLINLFANGVESPAVLIQQATENMLNN